MRTHVKICTLSLLACAGSAVAQPLHTLESSKYLIIAMGPENSFGGQPGVGQALNANNFELGANKAPVPAPSSFGPGLLGNVPNIPLNAQTVTSGVCGDGNIAITSMRGRYNLQDVGVYADLGIRTAASRTFADAGTQNSFFNDPNMFPNTFTPTGFTNPGVNRNTGGTGAVVNPGSAVQSTRMDANNFAGVTGNFNFNPLLSELAAARTAINALVGTTTLNVASSGGTINSHTTLTLGPGLNVIDIVTGGSDFKIENSNFVVNGPAGSKAIFRLPSSSNMLVANANILVGNGGIGTSDVVFFTDRQSNNQHFNFSNTVLNGVAFWSLGLAGGEININNAQGCVQLVADKVTLNDVRFCGCGFSIPTPGTLALAGLGLFVVARRRRAGR
jgi:uncharacterized protein (TIGR03382 family)